MPKRKYQATQDKSGIPPDLPVSISELARLRTEHELLSRQRNELLHQAQQANLLYQAQQLLHHQDLGGSINNDTAAAYWSNFNINKP